MVAFKVLLEVLANLRGLTLKLQMEAGDVFYAYNKVTGIVDYLKGMRSRSERELSRIFMEANKLGKNLHGEEFEIVMPRVNRRQVHHSNVETQSAEDYFRVTIYNEFLSHVIAELKSRFVDNASHGVDLLHLLPSECISSSEGSDHDVGIPEKLATAVAFYENDLPHATLFPTEYRMWVNKWNHQCPVPKKLVDVLGACDGTNFPNIKVLLQLALTLPITSCQSERSFSQLKIIKTPHRSTMSSRRLSGLALMKINRNICETLSTQPRMKELVQLFQVQHPRRMKLPYVLSD